MHWVFLGEVLLAIHGAKIVLCITASLTRYPSTTNYWFSLRNNGISNYLITSLVVHMLGAGSSSK